MSPSPRPPAALSCSRPRTSLIQRHNAKWPQIARVGRSACDQCRFCTEFCPRYLLGHPIQPHRAMQSLGFATSPAAIIAGTLYCCECNLCTPVRLPRRSRSQERLRRVQARGARQRPLLHRNARIGHAASHGRVPPRAHEAPDRAPRSVRVQQRRPAGRARILACAASACRSSSMPARPPCPWSRRATACAQATCWPLPEEGKLGARIHASIAGVVRLTHDAVVIDA